MNTTVGYALVSTTHQQVRDSCGTQGCGDRATRGKLCPRPKMPRCNAICLHRENHLEEHPECQKWQKDYTAWEKAHPLVERPTGGTRIGPLHYFQDCKALLHVGPRRKDARIVPIDAGVAADLGLPTCKACAAKMAPLEKQFVAEEHEHQGAR